MAHHPTSFRPPSLCPQVGCDVNTQKDFIDNLDNLWAFTSPHTSPSPFEGYPQQPKGYVALATLQKVVNVDQQVMQRHRNTIIDCLKAIDDGWRVDF